MKQTFMADPMRCESNSVIVAAHCSMFIDPPFVWTAASFCGIGM